MQEFISIIMLIGYVILIIIMIAFVVTEPHMDDERRLYLLLPLLYITTSSICLLAVKFGGNKVDTISTSYWTFFDEMGVFICLATLFFKWAMRMAYKDDTDKE